MVSIEENKNPSGTLKLTFFNHMAKVNQSSQMNFEMKHKFNFNSIIDKSLRGAFCRLFNNENNRPKINI